MSRVSRFLWTVREDLANFHPVVSLAALPARVLPRYAARRTRTGLLRVAGWRIGYASVFFGVPTIYGRGRIVRRLTVGEHTCLSVGCMFELNQPITIGDRVALGHEVAILTTTHRIGRATERAGSTTEGPVVIGDGAWVGARATILPGVTIGAGAVVSAGSVVNKDVPPNSVVAGVPATVVVKRLPG